MYATLGMIYPGASTTTAGQMQRAVGFRSNIDVHNREFQALLTPLHAKGTPMSVANGLWMQKGFHIDQRFMQANLKYFSSEVHQSNFAGAPDAARKEINAAVEKQTREKIKDLLPPGSINSLTKLVLTNAISFKDAWANPFDPAKTRDQDFFVSPQKSVTTKFMEQQNAIFLFHEDDRITAVELPYQNGRFSMLIVLPKGDAPKSEKDLTHTYNSWNFRPGRFKTLQLPKFKIDHEVEPVEILKHFGMTNAFQEGKADFSGISKDVRLFISGMFHKAFIEVDEVGTEAAAATAAVVQAESAIEPVKELSFIANKPFLFILRDRISNTILFIGKVNDPSR
jgi:serpin B